MKKEELFETINDINENDIKEAREYTPKKKTSWIKWAIPAICAALPLMIFTNPFSSHTADSPVTAGMFTVLAEYPEPVGDTMSGQEFLQSDEHWNWWESYREKMEKSKPLQEDISDYYSALMGKLLVSDDTNTVCSPLNTYIAFAMLAEVSDGNTRKQILDMLHVKDIETLRTNIKSLWEGNYADTPVFKSLLANSLWLNQSVSYKTDTLQLLADQYYASSFSGTPGTEEMDEALQTWTDQNTGGLLSEYVKNMKLSPDTVLAMVSTIYYKAMWTDPFVSEETSEQTFHGTKGDTTVNMMHKTALIPVYQTDTFTSIGLNLSDSGAMYFYLPNNGTDVNTLASDPDIINATRYRDQLDPVSYEVHLSIPKFKVSGTTDLKKSLVELGITDALDPNRSDFTPLTTDATNIFLSSADHSALVEIDEEGVTGAAYTELAFGNGAILPEDSIDFVLDRPFMFVITGQDGSVLFSGIVRNIE